MAWPTKQTWWNKRLKRGRESLAASVENIVEQQHEDLELVAEEIEEERDDEANARYVSLVPPQLHLQSHVWPTVHVSQQVQAIHESSPTVRKPFSPPQETGHSRRLAGRSTRVHLQAVHTEPLQRSTTEQVHAVDICARTAETEPHRFPGVEEDQLVAHQKQTVPAVTDLTPIHYGCGVFNQGEEQLTILHKQITGQSVVNIMLAGNPGPVVVQYITLHPEVGFTVHMSAPTSASAPFNYIVWSGSVLA